MTKEDFRELVMRAYRAAKALIGMTPGDRLDWKPGANFMSLGQVIYHVADGLGGDLRRLFSGDWPAMTGEELAEMMKVENRPSCAAAEALRRLEEDEAVFEKFLAGISEADFASKPVSTPWGTQGKMEPMAVSFLEHFNNHKMQLFLYLKLLGFPVNTGTLYFGEPIR